VTFALPAAARARCEVYVVEVAFCADSSFQSRLTAKHRQHVDLVSALRLAGWAVHGGLKVLLFGTSGTIFHPTLEVLEELGVSHAAALRCLNALHVKAVNSAHSIICDRRRLERCALPPAPRVGLDDPP
jgi:hypothetical protein